MLLELALFAATPAASALNNAVNDYLVTFISIVLEALPFIVFGCILSGLMEELLPQDLLQKVLPKNRYLAIGLASLMGFVLPMCECGIVAVMRRLLAKGMPAACAIAYMLSAPILNPIVLWSTYLAFGGMEDASKIGGFNGVWMAGLRGLLGFTVAMTVANVFYRMVQRGVPVSIVGPARSRLVENTESLRIDEEEKPSAAPALLQIGALGSKPAAAVPHGAPGHVHDEHCGHDHAPGQAHVHVHKPRTWLDRAIGISEIAVHDFLDIAAYLCLGAAVAALVRVGVPNSTVEWIGSQPLIAVPAMMLFAILISLCSEADAFVAANLSTVGLGGKLSMLVLGPMLDLKLLVMYRWVFTKTAVKTLVLWLLGMVFALGVTVQLIAAGAAKLAAPATPAAVSAAK
jgi:uncharacterized protein